MLYFTADGSSNRFSRSREKEVAGLFERGMFIEVQGKLQSELRVFNTQFVDSIKNEGTDKAYEKSLLVIQRYNDDGKKTILT